MINPEWKRRIDRWRDAMPKLFYKPIADIDFEGFVTKEHLSVEQAMKGKFSKMPVGTKWGAKWEYGWFKADVKIPKDFAGKRIAMRVKSGGESAVFVNGVGAGGNSVAGWDNVNDIGGREITLTRKAKGGEIFKVLVEGYAGHGIRECGGGPCPYGNEMVPEPKETQVVVGESSFGVWNEDLYQLWLDTETLCQLHEVIGDKESLRASEIADALMRMTLAVDLELPPAEALKSIREGRAVLKEALSSKNGSTEAVMNCFGHSHIDVAWLWPLEETERKCCRTFSSQLSLMEEYPEFKFLQSQPHTYWMVKKHYPELYKRIKDAIKRGQWIPEGGMWVEADTNISGGESLIRQFMHGKKFYKEELGVDSKMMWLPDVFGYTGSLPQIMASCGITCFSTQKIFWTYNGGDQFPYNIFWWEGIDGTKVLSYIHNDYNSGTDPRAVKTRWNERVQKDAFHKGRLMPFGYGDGGGGPTRNHLEYLRRGKDLQGLPKCEIGHPVKYLEKMDTSRIPSWTGELYFQAHRGTYTTQAKTKKGNRKSEFALREAELWGAVAGAIAKFKYPLEKADTLWKLVLLNQFHDIIPGSSIHRVYEQAEADYAEVIGESSKIAAAAKGEFISKDASSLTVFNSLSWDRPALLELPKGVSSLKGAPAQKSEGKDYALLDNVPSCGWASFKKGEPSALPASKAVKLDGNVLENEFVKFKFNASGEIVSAIDKASGHEFISAPANSFHLYKDVPSWFDAWDVDSMYKLQPVEIGSKASVKAVAKGPLFATLRVTRNIGGSELSQDITLKAGSRRLDFKTVVDWKESHKLLKVNFPTNVASEDALCEIQFGHLRRPTHASKLYDASRFEVCNHKWTALAEEERGAAVLNDSKYGVSAEGSSINLTLLRAPLAPDMTADKGMQEFSYSFMFWSGAFKDSGVVKESYDLNVPVSSASGAAEAQSLFKLDDANIVIETVKPAEDGSGDVVVRLYESMRSSRPCVLSTSLPAKKLFETDMLEGSKSELKLKDGAVKLKFKPFEIKTLRFKL